MKKCHRILSIALAVLMAASLCALPAGAGYNGPKIVQVIGGKASFAITEDGSLWGWGCENPEAMGFPGGGQLGRPQLLMSGVKSVASCREGCGASFGANSDADIHTLILKTDGNLYGVGGNSGYALGQGDSKQTYTVSSPAFILSDVRQASAAMCLNAAVTNGGDLYIWGHYDGRYNVSGEAKRFYYPTPTKVASGVKQVDVGQDQVIYLTNGGDVYTFGVSEQSNNGQYSESLNTEPQLVMSGCKDVSVGDCHYFAIKNDGTLWFWGSNSNIHLVKTSDTRDEFLVDKPVQVASNVRDVEAAQDIVFYVDNSGGLWGGGSGIGGPFGIEDTQATDGVKATFSRPKEIVYGEETPYGFGKVDSNVKQVSPGATTLFMNYVLYLKNDGTMWGSGLNNVGQLGNGKHRDLPGNINPLPSNLYGSGCNPFPILAGLSDPGFQYKAPLPASGFYDAPDGRYYTDAVKWAVSKGVTKGATDTTFEPDRNCTRAEVITFLWRANGSPAPAGGGAVTDLGAPGSYYYDAARWAAGKGLYTGTKFRPNDLCTRAMVVDFLWKLAGSPQAGSGAQFPDVPADLAGAVAWAVAEGITTGADGGKFNPDGICTRGQIVTFLHRAYVL